MAGMGASFSLLIANMGKIGQFVSVSDIQLALFLLLLALVISVLARLLSSAVSAALSAHASGQAIGNAIAASGRKFEIDVFIGEYTGGLLWPWRWLARKSIDRARREGGTIGNARLFAKLSQVQAMLVLIQALLVLCAAGCLVFGMNV
ncbi:MAG: hypothetical protein B7X46_04720 [Thiomonas sp. 15-66-11]|nr:MAG: hypothetical protein B7X46_04720 [Thiomonas sp. 15-66-11]